MFIRPEAVDYVREMGRRCIGIELDRGYFDVARWRIAKAQAQLRLPIEQHVISDATVQRELIYGGD